MTAEELITLMVKHHILKAKACVSPSNEYLELEMHPSAFAPVASAEVAIATPPIGEVNGGYPTAEELLFASSPYPLTAAEINASPPEKP